VEPYAEGPYPVFVRISEKGVVTVALQMLWNYVFGHYLIEDRQSHSYISFAPSTFSQGLAIERGDELGGAGLLLGLPCLLICGMKYTPRDHMQDTK